MNFTVLSPEQQRAAQDAERIERQRKEAEGMRGGGGGWRGRRGGSNGWGGGAESHDRGRAALRELARRGVLEREEVKAMLRPGPLQDFRGSVLQVTSPESLSMGSEGVGIVVALVAWLYWHVCTAALFLLGICSTYLGAIRLRGCGTGCIREVWPLF